MEERQVSTIFIFQLKLGRIDMETARDIDDAFGLGTTIERPHNEWKFKKVCSGDGSLEVDERSARPSTVNSSLMRALVNENPRKAARKLSAELDITHMEISRILKETGNSKSAINGCLSNSAKIKKHSRFDVSSVPLLRNNKTNFLILLWFVLRNGSFTKIDDASFSGWTAMELHNTLRSKHFIQRRLRRLSAWWSVAGALYHSFLNPGETIRAKKFFQQTYKLH